LEFLKFEFKRLFSRPFTYIVLFIVPLIFALISSSFFRSFSESDLRIGIYTLDKSPLSKFTVGVIVSLFKGGTIKYVDENYEKELQSGNLNAVVVIPNDFTNSLFAGKKTMLKYIPSPVNTELSAAAYLVFKRMFEDLGGGPFFNPKVLREMYTASNVPAPALVTEKSIDFSQVFATSMIFIITMFIGLLIGAGLITRDKEIGILKQFTLSNFSILNYLIIKFFTTLILSFISGLLVYMYFLLKGFNMSTILVVLFIALNAIFYSSLGIFISSFSQNTLTSNLLGSTFSVFFLLINGPFVNLSEIPSFSRKFVELLPTFRSSYIIRSVQFFGKPTNMLKNESKFILLSITISILFLLISWGRLNFTLLPDRINKESK